MIVVSGKIDSINFVDIKSKVTYEDIIRVNYNGAFHFFFEANTNMFINLLSYKDTVTIFTEEKIFRLHFENKDALLAGIKEYEHKLCLVWNIIRAGVEGYNLTLCIVDDSITSANLKAYCRKYLIDTVLENLC